MGLDRKVHRRIAYLAAHRGLMRRTVLFQVLADLDKQDEVDTETFWIQSGRLDREQLEALVNAPSAPQRPQTIAGMGMGRERSPADPIAIGRSATVIRLEPEPAPLPPPEQEERFAVGNPDLQGAPKGTRYVPMSCVGIGGMGMVYASYDTFLARTVAVKTANVHSEMQNPQELLEREARLVAELEHPGIVPIYDAGSTDEGPYYVMRYLEQSTLGDVLTALAAGDAEATATYSLGRLLRYFVQVCQALDYAHSRGVVHCDLKPENILIGKFGEVVVIDWGIAFHPDDKLAPGGTIGYIAPEVLRQETIDARSDVFGLGAILYEILALAPAYDHAWLRIQIVFIMSGAIAFPAARPPAGRPDRPIPDELAQICLKALSVDPAHRHRSAAELAADIEAYLEGTKERERKARRAAELVEEGDQLAEMYREYVESRPAESEELGRLRDRIAPWESPEAKRELWEAEDRLSAIDAVGVRTFQAAVAAYEHALDQVRSHEQARRGLAQLYFTEARRARERRDETNRIYFEELARQYDDGTISVQVTSKGSVELDLAAGATVAIARFEEVDRRLVPAGERVVGVTPLPPIELEPNAYIIRVTTPAGNHTEFPVSVRAGGAHRLAIDAAVIDTLAPGERYIPGGVALLGGDELSPWGATPREIDVPAFVIDELPVTFADYLAFLDDLFADDPRAATHLPANTDGRPLWRRDGNVWVPTETWSFERDQLLPLPVFGITSASAQAYAAWRGKVRDVAARLPYEAEWEKAARGTDGRLYPWGDRFDASFCKMYESRPGNARPEAPGAFPIDASPYGVRDLAGGVADWVIPHGIAADRQVVARGGAWCDWRADCRCNVRRPYRTNQRTARVGFRVARPATRIK